MDLTQKFKEIEKSSSKMALKINGTLLNIHGIGAERIQMVKSTVYDQIDIEQGSTLKEGVSKSTRAERIKTETVRTFPRNGNSNLVIPLGGDRGYFKGALQASLVRYGTKEMQDKSSPVYGLRRKVEQSVFIQPTLIEAGDKVSNPLDTPAKFLIQRAGMMPEYYDYINSVPFEVNLFVESDIGEEIILNLLAFTERLGIGPKRRGQIRIERIEKL